MYYTWPKRERGMKAWREGGRRGREGERKGWRQGRTDEGRKGGRKNQVREA